MKGPDPPKTPPPALLGVQPAQERRQCKQRHKDGATEERREKWQRFKMEKQHAKGQLCLCTVCSPSPISPAASPNKGRTPGALHTTPRGCKQPAQCTIRALLPARPSSTGASSSPCELVEMFCRSVRWDPCGWRINSPTQRPGHEHSPSHGGFPHMSKATLKI